MHHPTIVFAMIAAAVTLLAWNRIPAEIVSTGVSLALFLSGILTVWGDFGDLAVIFISSLFVAQPVLRHPALRAGRVSSSSKAVARQTRPRSSL
jgi:hypothetical protein